MAKLKRTAQDHEALAIKNTNISVKKKQRKKNDKKLSNGIYKNDSKKLSTCNEIAKNIFTNKQNSKKKEKHSSKNKFDVKDTEKSDILTKINMDSKVKYKMKNKLGMNNTERSNFITCSKNDKKTEIFKKIQINTNSKTKRKKKNNKRKQNMNLNHSNKNAIRVDGAKERNKKLQVPKKSIDFEHKEAKIKKFKKVARKKMKQMSAKAEAQQIKTDEMLKLNKHMMKIIQLEEMLTRKLQAKQKDRVMMLLKVTKFRFMNDMLYNNDSSQSKNYFKQNPNAFKAYQAGYKWQLEQWIVNPLDVIISSIIKLPIDNVIADLGCGEARLAASVPHTVHSFDFIALNDRVKACDMAHTPLQKNSVHVVVFCLSLMGSNLNDYIIEANRILKKNGILKVAEVENRFEDVKDFMRLLRNYGFKNTWKDLSHNLFYFMDFKKKKDISLKRETLPPITLKSSLYEKK